MAETFILRSLLAAMVGGLLALDRVCVQIMVNRPIVAAPLVGLILGDPAPGLMIGAVLELLWVDRPQIGNYMPPNETLLAVVMTAAAAIAGFMLGDASRLLPALSFFLFLPLAWGTQRLDAVLARWNDGLSDRALQRAEAADVAGVERLHRLAIVRTWLVYTGFLLVFVPIAAGLLILLAPHLPNLLRKALLFGYAAAPLIVAALAVQATRLPYRLAVFCGAAAILATVWEIAVRV